MGADAFHGYFGIRWEIPTDFENEISALEERKDPRQLTAKTHHLDSWWGSTTDEKVKFLIVGKLVGHFGWQHEAMGRLPSDTAFDVMEQTRQKLERAGFRHPAEWIFQFEPDS